MKRKFILPVIVASAALVYYLVLYAPIERSCSFYSMGGILTEIKASGTDKKTMDIACGQIRVFFEDIENEISNYRENSFLSKMNLEKNKSEVRLPQHMFLMVKESLRISELTLGYYDVSVLPVLDVWKKAQKQNKLPSAEELKSALEKVSYKKMVLDKTKEAERILLFKNGGMELDLGAIAKGYMGDESQKIMEKLGIRRGLINCGGGIVVFDRNDPPDAYTITVYNPDKITSKKNIYGEFGQNVILLANGSVQTSGDYNRFYTISGKRYSHIVDPHTGLPSSGCHSITVKSTIEGRSGAIADGFGTGYCAMIAAGKNPDDLHITEVEIIQLKK